MGRKQRETFDGQNLDEVIVGALDDAYERTKGVYTDEVAMFANLALAAAVYRLAIAVENTKR